MLARQFIGRRSYKNDTPKKQTADQHEARRELLQALRKEAPQRYDFSIDAPDSLFATIPAPIISTPYSVPSRQRGHGGSAITASVRPRPSIRWKDGLQTRISSGRGLVGL